MTWSMPAMPLSMFAPSVRSSVSLTASRLGGQETNKGEIDALRHIAAAVSARGGERDRAHAGFSARPRARQFARGRPLRFAAERARLCTHRRFWDREAASVVGE